MSEIRFKHNSTDTRFNIVSGDFFTGKSVEFSAMPSISEEISIADGRFSVPLKACVPENAKYRYFACLYLEPAQPWLKPWRFQRRHGIVITLNILEDFL